MLLISLPEALRLAARAALGERNEVHYNNSLTEDQLCSEAVWAKFYANNAECGSGNRHVDGSLINEALARYEDDFVYREGEDYEIADYTEYRAIYTPYSPS